MLDLKYLRDHIDEYRKILEKRHSHADVDSVLALDTARITYIREIELLRSERNSISKEDSTEHRSRGKEIKDRLKELEPKLKETEEKLHEALWDLPNVVSNKAPVGKDESENKVVRLVGNPKKFPFAVKDHVELGKTLDIIDFESGTKVAGSQFYFLKNEAVLLELALAQYALSILVKEGFTPWFTPDLAKSRFYLSTGYQPKGPEAQIYRIEEHDLGLIATAEITLAAIHADEILEENTLPKKYVGYSHCFRVEAGGYGRYSKGLYRVHQFTKVEMFLYTLAEESETMHEYLLSLEEKIFQGLNIPYRVLEMCTGDLGSQAVRKFDIEAWMPGRNDYGEVTSTSNCTDFQARRLNVKVKKKNGQTEHLHMLNGTAIATSRALIAILENYQKQDGSVIIPEVLRPFVGKEKISPRL